MIKFNLNKRFYTKFFSQHIGLSLGFLFFLLLSFTPMAKVPVQQAVNQDLRFTFRYIALLCLLVGFRGNIPSLKGLHKAFSVMLGLVPTTFMSLLSMGLFFVSITIAIISFIGGSFDFKDLSGLLPILGMWAVTVTLTVGIWLLTVRVIFEQYKAPHELDEESNFASVAMMLILLGAFGGHRFFVGRIPSGILYFLTMGFLGFGVLVDGILLMLRKFKDAEGNIV